MALAGMSAYASSLRAKSTAETTAGKTGANDLIAANFSQASTRETAQQTQLQLADSALSITSQISQYMLKLSQ